MLTHVEAESLQQRFDSDTFSITRDQCIELDAYVKSCVLGELQKHLDKLQITSAMKTWITIMARCHYGDMKTDQLLCALNCYPSFIKKD